MIIPFVLLIFFNFYLLKAETIINCLCKVGDLEELEKLNKDHIRIRVEQSNGLIKYLDNQLSYYSYVGCDSLSVYEAYGDKSKKRCRTCKPSGWTALEMCRITRCDRDVLKGQPLLQLTYSKKAPSDQKLFLPGEAIAVFKYSSDKLCKACQIDGEWSKFAESEVCQELLALKTSKNGCKYDNLKQIESKQLAYVRIRLESPDGLSKINENNIEKNELPANTVVVYQRYLMNLPNQMYRISFKKYKLSTPFTKKFCRYCDDGIWSEIESCVSLNCDKDLLTGNPDLILKSNEKVLFEGQNLFAPFSVIAMSKFGDDQFCKQCHENGEWSKYAMSELCKHENDDIYAPKPRNPNNSKLKYLQEIYQKESNCDLKSLEEIEKQHNSLERVYYVSLDRKSKLNPSNDANLPSRSISLYQTSNKSSTKRFCSLCVNGIWSNITSDCTDDSLYYCEREDLSVSGTFVVDYEKQAPITQNLFEPGKVMVFYDISETTRLCKICVSKGEYAEWSKYAETSLCDIDVAFKNLNQINLKIGNSCQLKDLKEIENDEYNRESIQTSDAKSLIYSESINDNSVAIYHKIISNSIKYCRKCLNGKWERSLNVCPLEFTVKKCDPSKVRGANYFVFTDDGTTLEENEQKHLVFPSKVAAVYVFGMQKYCKMCNEDGTWSSYPQYQICDSIKWKTK